MVPDDTPDQLAVRVTYDGLADGVYYFTLKSRATGQDWSEVTQRRFLLDQTPPEPFSIESVSNPALPDVRLLSWLASDATSGVEQYRLLVDGREQGIVTSPLEYKSEWIGRNITIIATDAAGNRRSSELVSTATPWSVQNIAMIVAAAIIVGGGLLIIRARARRRAGL